MGKKKKSYKKPKIIYERKIETLAAVCYSTWGGIGICRTADPCTHTLS